MLVTSIPQYIQNITNAKADLTANTATTLYTAPSGNDLNASVFSSIIVSNDSGSADTITVAANTTIELLTRDLVLQGGEILKVTAATADRLHVVASIQEFAQNRNTTSGI